MRLPDGNTVRLTKTRNASVWTGSNWIAQVSGRIITVKSSCGWTLIYNLGRLQQLKTPEGDTLNFVTDFAKGTRTLNANGKPVLTLRPDFDKTTTQKFWHLNFSGKHAILKMGKRPSIMKTRNTKTNEEIERKIEIDTLVSMKFDNEPKKDYNIGMTALKVGSEIHAEWNAKTLELTKCNDVRYQFVRIAGIDCRKTIEKDDSFTIYGTSSNAQIEISKMRDSKTIYKTEIFWLPSIRGMTKKRSIILPNGTEQVVERNFVDETGRIFKKIEEDTQYDYKYKGNEILITARDTRTNKIKWAEEYAADGTIKRFQRDSRIYAFKRQNNLALTEVALSNEKGELISKSLLNTSDVENLFSRLTQTRK
jgi:hypothetical protein